MINYQDRERERLLLAFTLYANDSDASIVTYRYVADCRDVYCWLNEVACRGRLTGEIGHILLDFPPEDILAVGVIVTAGGGEWSTSAMEDEVGERIVMLRDFAMMNFPEFFRSQLGNSRKKVEVC